MGKVFPHRFRGQLRTQKWYLLYNEYLAVYTSYTSWMFNLSSASKTIDVRNMVCSSFLIFIPVHISIKI